MLGIVMAGGKSTRMGTEKQMIMFKGKRLLDIACDAVKGAGLICLVAISKNAPLTMKYALSKFNCIITPGIDYSYDISYILNILDSPILTVPSDLPFLEEKHIIKMLKNFTGKSMAGVILNENNIVYTGINIVSNTTFDILYFFDDLKISVNLNSNKDLIKLKNFI